MVILKVITTVCAILSLNCTTIFVSAQDLPDSLKDTVVNSIEDTVWITGTEEEVLTNLKNWYTPGLVKEIWSEVKKFRKNETDWHSIYKVKKITLLSKDKNIAVLKADILEMSADNIIMPLQGIYTVKLLEGKWKIDSFVIKPLKQQNIDTSNHL